MYLRENQVKLLKEAVTRHHAKAEPLGTYYTQSMKGLVAGGLITTAPYYKNEKKLYGFVITQKGLDALKKIDSRTEKKAKKKKAP